MRVRAALLGGAAAACLLTACNDDGRELRPARPDQTGSVATDAPTTTLPADALGAGAFSTLPGEAVTMTPLAPVLVAPFQDGSPIPVDHTCEGGSVSPPLSWTGAPAETVEIAVTLVDVTEGGTILWAMSGIDPLAPGLAAGIVPEFAITSVNETGTAGYAGPCPAAGETHEYELTVHFLLQQTEIGDGSPADMLLAFIEGATLAEVGAIGTFTGAAS